MVQIAGVPQNDRGDEEVQAGGSILLVLVGAVADFPEAVKEDRTRQAVGYSPLLSSRLVPRRSGSRKSGSTSLAETNPEAVALAKRPQEVRNWSATSSKLVNRRRTLSTSGGGADP